MNTYYTLLTNVGLAKLLNAQALGTVVQWSHMAVGDGNGNPTTPVQTQTTLVRERYRAQLNQLAVDPQNPAYLVAELVVPSDVGGWTVHEVGIFDADGDMVAVANFPSTYKPLLADGAARDLAIRVIVETSNASTVQLKIDPAIVLASRSWVETNFLRRSKVAGGTAGQVLRKKSNTVEDFEWADPVQTNITVNTVEEVQTLADGQLLIDWSLITTVGAAYYVEGVRLTPADYTVTSKTSIQLAASYPAGTKVLGAKNEPAAHPTNYIRQAAPFVAIPGARYLIDGTFTVTLPPVGSLEVGAAVIFIKPHAATPIIQVDGANGEQIRTAEGIDTSVAFDINAEIVLVWTGTVWEV